MLDERLLDRVQVVGTGAEASIVAISWPFDVGRENRAGLDGLAVEHHGAGAAVAGRAAHVAAGEPEVLAQHVDEREASVDVSSCPGR